MATHSISSREVCNTTLGLLDPQSQAAVKRNWSLRCIQGSMQIFKDSRHFLHPPVISDLLIEHNPCTLHHYTHAGLGREQPPVVSRLSMLLTYKKIVFKSHRLAAFHSQCQWTRIFLFLINPMAMRTQLGFKQHRESRYLSQCSRELWFRHYYQWIFLKVLLALWVLEVHINGFKGITIHITESKIKKTWFDTNVDLLLLLLLLLHVTPFQFSPIWLLRVH